MTEVQADTYPCPSCQGLARVTPTANPHEFDWVCRCGACGLIAWHRSAEPPAFARQQPLFTELAE